MLGHNLIKFYLLLLGSWILSGQTVPETRAATIEKARAEKAAELTPEQNSKIERILIKVREEYQPRAKAGFRGIGFRLGKMPSGSGFAFGPKFTREDAWRGALRSEIGATISTRAWTMAYANLLLPHLANDKLFFDLFAVRHNYGGINYYGPGPDSTRTGRSNYRYEDAAIDGTLGLTPGALRRARFGGSAGYLKVNVGPGTDDRFASAETQYSPLVSPGIDRQTSFLRYGAFAQFNYLDDPLGPRSGGMYVFQASQFLDQKLSLHDFQRYDIELQQYIPFLNKSHLIAWRARAVFTDADGGQTVPFYLQPVLGGGDDLRGFRPFRFSDRNSMVINTEYRWAVFSGMDGAVFWDVGKVFPKKSQFNFANLESSLGFGMRFNAANKTFIRLDVGFSHEGFLISFKFNDPFRARPFGTSTAQPVF